MGCWNPIFKKFACFWLLFTVIACFLIPLSGWIWLDLPGFTLLPEHGRFVEDDVGSLCLPRPHDCPPVASKPGGDGSGMVAVRQYLAKNKKNPKPWDLMGIDVISWDFWDLMVASLSWACPPAAGASASSTACPSKYFFILGFDRA